METTACFSEYPVVWLVVVVVAVAVAVVVAEVVVVMINNLVIK